MSKPMEIATLQMMCLTHKVQKTARCEVNHGLDCSFLPKCKLRILFTKQDTASSASLNYYQINA